MNREEALKLLETAPYTDKFSAVNPSLTQKQSVEIVKVAIVMKPAGSSLSDLLVKRVWQVVKNQKQPRY